MNFHRFIAGCLSIMAFFKIYTKLKTAKPKLAYICWMDVNDALIDKLANLARLQFDDTQKESIKNDLQRMIRFVEKLNEVDTTGVEPLLHMSEEVNVLRNDEVQGSVSRAEGLQNAPMHDQEFFKVPKVIKK